MLGHCLGLITSTKRYFQARSFCEGMGGQLFNIQSEKDNEKTKEIAGKKYSFRQEVY